MPTGEGGETLSNSCSFSESQIEQDVSAHWSAASSQGPVSVASPGKVSTELKKSKMAQERGKGP